MMRDDTVARLEHLSTDEPVRPTNEPLNRRGDDAKPPAPVDDDRVEPPRPTEDLRARTTRDDTVARLEYLHSEDSPAGTTIRSTNEPDPTDDASSTATIAEPGHTSRTVGDRAQATSDGQGRSGRTASADEGLADVVAPKPADAEGADDEDPAQYESQTSQLQSDGAGTAQSGDGDREGDRVAESGTDSGTRFGLDSSVNGEQVRDRFERWDPERVAHSRPLSTDAGEASTGATAEATDPADARKADQRNAVAYIAAAKEARPWLVPAASCDPVVQNVYASVDLGDGHGHIRHGPMGDDALYARRVAFNEDPAQTDPVKRSMGIDGLSPNLQHYCGKESTRIHDADAFAAAYAGATENPDVRAILETPWSDDFRPGPVAIPIEELLGPTGHEQCSGFTLKGDWPESKAARKQWIQARDAGSDLAGMPEPEVEQIPTFEDGDINVVFKGNPDARRYEIYTLYPRPRDI
ncbi:hypothetical protein AB0L70_02440 [Kribbella sp. NPDC051952]|uniref:hypothetical protein n=1 Tax=Kribbella sp. NPDC051952 TaxID=3154851 RepID=UPI0034329DD0